MQINSSAVKEFRKGFTGEIIVQDDPAYEETRKIFNAMIDKRPGVIAQCANVDDVVRSVRFGRSQGLEIAVRGGGKGLAGEALTNGGLVIDLRRMNSVSVDPGAGIVTVAGGATMRQLDLATESYGLATTGSRSSTTGVGGFILNGGDGWLSRKMGLTCDNLLAVELVTADGRLDRACKDENPELFWALHGGGGNFGVATSFTLRLHELPLVTAMILLWSPESGPEVLRAYRDFIASAPDEIGGGALYLTGPDGDFVPRHLVGGLMFAVLVAYAGPLAEAREVANPLFKLAHEAESVKQMTYAELQCLFDDPQGYRSSWSPVYLNSLPDDAIDLFRLRADEMIVPSPSRQALLPQGGAINSGNFDYPVPWRHSFWSVHSLGMWSDPAGDENGSQWVEGFSTDLKPWTLEAVYPSFFFEDESVNRAIAYFGWDDYHRLARVKAKYDPDNVFHLNRNIKPD